MISTIHLKDKMDEIRGKHCSPIDIAQVNDHVMRMSYVDGEFHWHKHTNQDELFYILKGKLVI
jgi:mannose-6-phosphate isomerase-like protein (cupin superfamily)